MIDTIKIFTMINQSTFMHIKRLCDIKTSYNENLNQTFYTIINGHIVGKYKSSISIKVDIGSKYKFNNMYYIEVEGSYHKFINGYNSHNGFYNVQTVCFNLIKIIENSFDIKLPNIKHWFLQRIDIAKCYDLVSQDNVKLYINNISLCDFPKRNNKYFEDESLYIAGYTTTLKIYNKLAEFNKNDLSKFKNTDFNIVDYYSTIKGFLRFECEIKKRKLVSIYKKQYIRVTQVTYNELEKIWHNEFEKLLKIIDTQFNLIQNDDDVKNRLYQIFSHTRAKHLFDFYVIVQARGIKKVKFDTDKSTYYKNIADLKKCGIDLSQKLKRENYNFINKSLNFNPFKDKDIL